MSSVSEIRAATLSITPKFVTRKYVVNGAEIVLRQPTIKTRGEIYRRSTGQDGKVDSDLKAIWTLIYCAVDSDGNRVYSDADFDAMMECPTESWVDTCGLEALYAALGMTGNQWDEKKTSNGMSNENQSSGLPSS